MSFRQKISTFKKDIKDRFKGSKRNRDKKGPGTSGESAGLEESLSRSESPFVGGGDRDLEGSGSNPVGGHIGSTDRPAQRDESEPVPAVETKTGPEGEGEGGVDENEAGQTQPSYPHPDVKAVVEGGHGERVERVPSDTSISESAKPNGM